MVDIWNVHVSRLTSRTRQQYGGRSEPPKNQPNTEQAISRFHKRKVHNTEIVEEHQDDPPGPPVSENDLPDLPESDLNIPDDPILDFVNSQCHSSEDLDQALQAYQAYQIPSPQNSTMTPERSINHHLSTM